MAKATNCQDEQNLPPPPPISTRFRRKVNLETILKRKLNLDFVTKENASKPPEPPQEETKFAFHKYMGPNAQDIEASLCEDVEDTQDVDREGLPSIEGSAPIALPRVVIQHLENDPHTKEALTCPICRNLMRPPIYSCPSGHPVCGECKKYLSMCPKAECMGKYSARHFALEKVWNSLNVHCEDCGSSVLANFWEQHEEVCKESWSDL